MYTVVWQYETTSAQAAAFEAFYGSAGPWVELFHRGGGFRETVLLRDVATATRYVTLDRWDSAAAYDRFRSEQREEYARLDEAAAQLTCAEQHVGSFDS